MKYGSTSGGAVTTYVIEVQDIASRYQESNAEKHKSKNKDEAVQRKRCI